MTDETAKRTTDTYPLESRIFAEMLDTGETYELTPDDFQTEEYSIMWDWALQAKDANAGALDHVLLADYILRQTGVNQGGWLEAKWEQRIGPQNIPAYVQSLKDHNHAAALKRTLTDCMADTGKPGESRERAIAALRNLAIRGTHRLLDVKPVIAKVIADMEERLKAQDIPGVTTGISKLNAYTGGWQRSDLALIGARPSVGKTALMISMALSAARKGHRVGIVSAEQPAEQIMQRMLSQTADVAAWKLRNPRMIQDREWPSIPQASKALADLPIKIYDASAPTVGDVRVAASELETEVLFVDYVQRLKGTGSGRYEQVSSVALGLKELARDLNIPVVALAQINRAGLEGASMAHLKGSGDLEQEADVVAILERPDKGEVATLTVDKNRHGPVGMIELYFRPETMVYGQLERR